MFQKSNRSQVTFTGQRQVINTILNCCQTVAKRMLNGSVRIASVQYTVADRQLPAQKKRVIMIYDTPSSFN